MTDYESNTLSCVDIQNSRECIENKRKPTTAFKTLYKPPNSYTRNIILAEGVRLLKNKETKIVGRSSQPSKSGISGNHLNHKIRFKASNTLRTTLYLHLPLLHCISSMDVLALKIKYQPIDRSSILSNPFSKILNAFTDRTRIPSTKQFQTALFKTVQQQGS